VGAKSKTHEARQPARVLVVSFHHAPLSLRPCDIVTRMPFVLPHAFVELHRERRFDYWGAPYASLSDEQRTAIINEREPEVLWWQSIEWDQGLEELREETGDGMWRPGLVRFAGNGYGDAYCWYPHWQGDAAEPPIVFCSHDDIEGSYVFARSFGECLLRCMLESVAVGDEPERASALFDSHARIIGPWLNDSERARVRGVQEAFSPTACASAAEKLARDIGNRTLHATMATATIAWIDRIRSDETMRGGGLSERAEWCC
jgi:hypothetical protein